MWGLKTLQITLVGGVAIVILAFSFVVRLFVIQTHYGKCAGKVDLQSTSTDPNSLITTLAISPSSCRSKVRDGLSWTLSLVSSSNLQLFLSTI